MARQLTLCACAHVLLQKSNRRDKTFTLAVKDGRPHQRDAEQYERKLGASSYMPMAEEFPGNTEHNWPDSGACILRC
jgi:hypothetical protein